MKNQRPNFTGMPLIISLMINLITFSVSAQQNKIDSLSLVLKTVSNDSNKVVSMNELSKAYINASNLEGAIKNTDETVVITERLLKDKSLQSQWNDIKKAHSYTYILKANVYDRMGKYPESIKNDSIALKISEEIKDMAGIGNAYNNLGVTLWHQGSMDDAIKNLEIALKVRTETKDKQTTAITLSNIGGVYNSWGKYPEALSYYLKGLKLCEEIADKKMIPIINLNIGTIYHRQEKSDEALIYFLAALKIFEETGNKNGIASASINIGVVHNSKKNYNEASKYYTTALPILRELGEPMGLATTLNNLSDAYMNLGKYTEALAYQTEALEIWDKTGVKEGIIASYLTMGTIYTRQNKFVEGEKYLKDALDLSKEIGMADVLKESYIQLSNLSAAKKDYLKALEYYKSYTVIKDSVLNETSNKQMGEMKTLYETEKKDKEIQLLNKDKEVQQKEISKQKIIRNSFLGGLTAVLIFSIVIFSQKKKITKEKKRSDELLLNILPSEVAEELKAKGSADAKQFDDVTVMFTDFKGFTQLSEKLTPSELVAEIHTCFKAFDHIITKHNIEKIKTIGDSYMCAGGLPVANKTNANEVVNAALEIQQFMESHLQLRKTEGKEPFEIRIGIHTGPVVAGIVGVKKFAYDIWGDTVNIASRMESSGEAGKVNISGSTYELVKEKFNCLHRGKIQAKNKGEIDMYFVECAK